MAKSPSGWRLAWCFKGVWLLLILMPVWLPALLRTEFGVPPPDGAARIVQHDLHTPSPNLPDNLPGDAHDAPLRGALALSDMSARISASQQRQELKPFEPASRSIGFTSRQTNQMVLIAAPAMDGSVHVPNAYLLRRAPFTVSQAWMPLFAVADHLRYELDDVQFKAREEVWLTTTQAWSRARGDCEDHAILLADWLIDMGIDARVVLGLHDRTGHAWVVVLREGKEYLLEATSKRKLKRWSAYPLARTLPAYHPDMMFNRHTLWRNSGSPYTVTYSGERWQRMLTFHPG